MRHPVLFLILFREHLVDMLQEGNLVGAMQGFNSLVLPLHGSNSEYTPVDFVEDQILAIKGHIDTGIGVPTDNNKVLDMVLDYFRLYFPTSIGHNNGEGTLWNLVMICKDEDGNIIFVRDTRKKYRCLLCQWDGGSSTGICAMSYHLKGIRRSGRCSKLTPNICHRLSIDVPPGRQPRHQITPYVLPPPPAAALALPLPSPAPPAPTPAPPAPAPAPAPLAQVGLLHAMTAFTFAQELGGDMENIQVTVNLNMTKIRTLVEVIRSLATVALTLPNDGMVSAHTIRSILLLVRDEVNSLQAFVNESLYHGTIPEAILPPLNGLSNNITGMLEFCLNAMIYQAVGALVDAVEDMAPSHHNVLAGPTSSVPPNYANIAAQTQPSASLGNMQIGQEANANASAQSLAPIQHDTEIQQPIQDMDQFAAWEDSSAQNWYCFLTLPLIPP